MLHSTNVNNRNLSVGTASFVPTISGGIFEVGDSTQANITAATYNRPTGDLTITIDGVHRFFS